MIQQLSEQPEELQLLTSVPTTSPYGG